MKPQRAITRPRPLDELRYVQNALPFESHLPVGQGVLTFRTMTEAVAGLERVNRDYAAHCQAARRIAAEHFDADRSLARLLEIVGFC